MKTHLALTLLLCTTLTACKPNSDSSPDLLTESQIEQEIDDILPQLTLDEKIALIHAQSKFSSPGVARLGIPELWMSDGPHGVRAEICWDSWSYAGQTNDCVTAFPSLTALAATWSQSLATEYGAALGREARYRGKNVLLGPGVNICRTPLGGRNFEYMGEDPLLVAQTAVAYIEGLQGEGVAACVKHFALNNQEVDRCEIEVHVSDRTLREIYLPAFEASVRQAHVWSIMGAYNVYNGEHCCHNKKLNNILKGEWAFDGATITDWGGAHSTEQSIANGLDLEMGTYTNGLTSGKSFAYDNYYLAKPYRDAINEGRADMQTLDDKVRRVLRLNLRTHNRIGHGRVGSSDHSDIARRVAREGIVLLKNEAQTLPLDSQTTMRIAVVGENATRSMTRAGGSSELKPLYEVSPLEGIQKTFRNAQITYAMGYSSGKSSYGRVNEPTENQATLHAEAVDLAKQSDLVIFVGGLNKNHQQDCEAGDRISYKLPFGQEDLIKDIASANKNIIVVLLSGNAVEMKWEENVRATLMAWHLGSECGNAIADILSGRTCPSGKLPITFYEELTDCGAIAHGAESYPGAEKHQTYKEELLVGYRYTSTQNIRPHYPFGHGLSYTTFSLQNATVSNVASVNGAATIEVDVCNTGSREGAEVVQVYVGKKDSQVFRPTNELRGYQKVWLSPGETQRVCIAIPERRLAYWDEAKNDWHIEKGRYTAYIGTSVSDTPIEIDFEVR